MSLSKVSLYTRAALGVTAPLVTVEVHISNGLPGLTLVGLPETTVKEARDRVRSAIINSGYDLSLRSGSPSISHPPICLKKGDDTIYPSLLPFSRPQSS